MPLYEYRCPSCGGVTTALRPAAESRAAIVCEGCGEQAQRIVSRPSVHRSQASKVARLDPRYDKLVDKAMASTQAADPDRYLRKMKPLSGD
ncbi:MAG: FmdB family zinc ribbon protein [Pseudomonadales bacterium]